MILEIKTEQDVSTLKVMFDTDKSTPEELFDTKLADGWKKTPRTLHITVNNYDDQNDEFKVAHIKLLLIREGCNDGDFPAFCDEAAGNDSYIIGRELINSPEYLRVWDRDYSFKPPCYVHDPYVYEAYSGYMQTFYVTPAYRGKHAATYLMTNLSRIVAEATEYAVNIKCLITLPAPYKDDVYAGSYAGRDEEPGMRQIIRKALSKNGFRAIGSQDAITQYGEDLYIKDYFSRYYIEVW